MAGHSGSITLENFPHSMVRLACRKCDRRGQYRRSTLIAEHGADIPLPDLRERIAGCPRQGRMLDGCGLFCLITDDLGDIFGQT